MRILFSSIFGIIGVVLIMAGCPMLAVAAGLYYFVDVGPSEWTLVPGTVTSINQTEQYDSDLGYTTTTYCPSVEYTTTSGETLEVNLNECSTPSLYEAGEAVEVYYDPAQPQHVQLKGGVQQVVGNVFIVVLGLIGGLLTLGGFGLIVVGVVIALRKGRTQSP
jgi:hypothetical protein